MPLHSWTLVALLVSICLPLALVQGNPAWWLPAVAPVLLAGGFFMLRHPGLIFWTLIVTSPFKDQLGIPVGGVTVRAYNGLAMAGIAWFAWRVCLPGEDALQQRLLKSLSSWFPLCILLLGKGFTLYFLDEMPPMMSKGFSVKFAVFFAMLVATGWLTHLFLTSRDILNRLIRYWLWISNGILVVGFLQILISNVTHIELVHHRDVIFFGRPYSVFREPDVLGSFVAASILMMIPQKLYPSAALMGKRALDVSIVWHALFLLLLFVRAAWVATICSAGVFWMAAWYCGKLKPLQMFLKWALVGMIPLVLLLPVVAPSLVESLTGRFSSLSDPGEDGASEYRLRELTAMQSEALAGSAPTRIFGHGDFAWTYWAPHLLGENFDRAAVEIMEAGGGPLITAGFNIMLTFLFDNGVIGLLCFIWFFTNMWIRVQRSLSPDMPDADFALLMMTALPVLAILVCFQFSYDPITPFFWVMIGMAFAALDVLPVNESPAKVLPYQPDQSPEENII